MRGRRPKKTSHHAHHNHKRSGGATTRQALDRALQALPVSSKRNHSHVTLFCWQTSMVLCIGHTKKTNPQSIYHRPVQNIYEYKGRLNNTHMVTCPRCLLCLHQTCRKSNTAKPHTATQTALLQKHCRSGHRTLTRFLHVHTWTIPFDLSRSRRSPQLLLQETRTT